MNGVPIPVLRNERKEMVFLSTRRSGEPGKAMAARKRAYREARNSVAKLTAQIGAMASANPASLAEAETIAGRQAELLDKLTACADALKEHAEALVRLSLRENHGDDAEAILDVLTDKQINDCVGIIETGDVPADFFHAPGIPLKPSSTSDSGAELSAGLPSAGSVEGTWKAETSGSKTP